MVNLATPIYGDKPGSKLDDDDDDSRFSPSSVGLFLLLKYLEVTGKLSIFII